MSIHLDNTYGAAFIGMVVAATLHGVSCVQAFYYFTNQNDTWHIKLPVAAVLVFDSVHQALITHTVYTYTVTDWGNPEQLQFIVWSILVEVIFNGVTAFIVQCFLALRIWRLSGRNIYITSVVVALVIAGFVSAIVYTSEAFRLTTLVDLAKIKGLSITVNVLGAAADLLIAATLCTLLNFSRTGFQKSDAIINKLIMFSVNTGLLTSLCALASLISILAAGNTFVYIAFFFCLGRLYTNSLLATLNARKILVRVLGNEVKSDTMSVSLRDFPKNTGAQRQNISIKIDTTTQEYHPGHNQKLHDQRSGMPTIPGHRYDEENTSY